MIDRKRLPDKPRSMPPRRKKGVPNKTTRILKEAILVAAECEGNDGKGKQGLVGYLRGVARKHPKEYTHLLGKVLPLEVQASLMQLQMQLTAQGAFGINGAMINVAEIKALPTEDLHSILSSLQRVTTPGLGILKRMDLPHDTQIAQTIDAEVVDTRPVEHDASPDDRVG
jgi:hypothetical protein